MGALEKELKEGDYDFGIGLDGDSDRVVFFTTRGVMIGPDIMTAILGGFVGKSGDRIGYEVRSSQAVVEYLKKKKLKPRLYKSGHAYIKEAMKKEGTVFAGEKSGHYFYQKLHNTDSPLLTILYILNILEKTKKTVAELAAPLTEEYIDSDEMNYTVNNSDNAISKVKEHFKGFAKKIIEMDGVSIYTDDYFFNVRKSNTEPLVRVNIEANTQATLRQVRIAIERILARS